MRDLKKMSLALLVAFWISLCFKVGILDAQKTRVLEFQPSLYPMRIWKNVVPFLYNNTSNRNDSYKIKYSDAVEIAIIKNETKFVPVSLYLDGEGGNTDLISELVDFVRIPAPFFDKRYYPSPGEAALAISTPDHTLSINIADPHYKIGCESFLKSVSLGEIRKLLQDAFDAKYPQPTKGTKGDKFKLYVNLIPGDQIYPKPGDKLVLHRAELHTVLTGTGDQLSPRTVSHLLMVDGQGYINIPSLSSFSKRMLVEQSARGIVRRNISQLDRTNFRWNILTPANSGRRLCLQELGDSLSTASSDPSDKSPACMCEDDCLCSALFFDQVRPPQKNIEKIRYLVEPPELEIEIQMPNGHLVTMPYLSSQTIDDAVNSAAMSLGESTVFDVAASDNLVVTVVTDRIRNPCHFPESFRIRLKKNNANNPMRAVVAPGDKIIVRLSSK